MKKLTVIFLVLGLSWSAFAGPIVFDHTISDSTGYVSGYRLDGEYLLVTGAGAYQIQADYDSYIEVRNTAPLQDNIGGIDSLFLTDSSTMNFFNGEMGTLTILDNAKATFSGGSIQAIRNFQDTDLTKHITFICDVDSVSLDGNILTGNWLGNKGSFSIILFDQVGHDSVYSNINFIPEPMSLTLLGLGALVLRRKKA